MNQIIITVDLGYGDSGKGSVVDALTRHKPTELIVRHSGGPQSAHNVVTPEGRHHTFSQFGSGTFVEGVKTYLGPDMLINPHHILVEADRLRLAEVHDALPRLFIDTQAPLITGFNIVLNQMREIFRNDKHGTCGVGIYETRKDTRKYTADHILIADDFLHLKRAKEKLLFLREEKYKSLKEEFPTLFGEHKHFLSQEAHNIFLHDRFIEDTLLIYARLAFNVSLCDSTVIADAVNTKKQVLFEASQGVLLDENYGFLPHVTGSTVTTKPAHDILDTLGISKNIYTLGIIRAYMSRHGHGPLVTESDELQKNIVEEHNSSSDPWAGKFRFGWFDPLAVRYAIAATGGIDSLAVTCLDQIATLPDFTYAEKYCELNGNHMTDIPIEKGLSDDKRLQLTDRIMKCTPVLQTSKNNHSEISQTISQTCGVDVLMTSSGKTASDKKIFF